MIIVTTIMSLEECIGYHSVMLKVTSLH